MLDRRSFLLAAGGGLATPFVRPSWAALPSFVVTRPIQALVAEDYNRVFDPRVVGHPDGGFLVSYSDAEEYGTIVRRFGADGKPVDPPVKLTGFTQVGASLISAPDGPYLVQSGPDLIVRRLGWSGQQVKRVLLRAGRNRRKNFVRAARLPSGPLFAAYLGEADTAWTLRLKSFSADLATATPSVAIRKEIEPDDAEVNAVIPWLAGTALVCTTGFVGTAPRTQVRAFAATGPAGPALTVPGTGFGAYPDPGLVRLPGQRFALLMPFEDRVEGAIYDRNLRRVAKLATVVSASDLARQAGSVPTVARYRDPGAIVCVLQSGLAVAWSSETGKLIASADVGFRGAVDLVRIKGGSFATAFSDGPDGASVGCIALR